MTVTNANMDTALMAGCLGLLRRCSIYYGNVLLQDVDNCAHLLQLKQTFVDQEVRNQVYQTQTGHFSGLKVESSAGKKGMFSLDAEDDGSGIVGLRADLVGADIYYNRKSAFRLQTTEAETPEWTVKLNRVFPFLNQTNLPLGLLRTNNCCVRLQRGLTGNEVHR